MRDRQWKEETVPDYLDFVLRLAIFCSLHSLLAAPRIKAWIMSLYGRYLPGYRLAYNLFSLMLFGWVMLAWQSTTVLFVAPGIWSLFLYGLQFIILWTGFVCLRQAGMADFLGTNFPARESRPSFTTSGCYGIVRHPLYLLGTVFLLLNPVITTRWIILTLASIPYMIFGALIEERRMSKQLGDRYRQYQRDVPFMIPKLRRQVSAD